MTKLSVAGIRPAVHSVPTMILESVKAGSGWRSRSTPKSVATHCIEALEQRIAPATFAVTTTADSGDGSLRQAIIDANGTAGPDDIIFSITGTGVQTIQPLTVLPAITEAVFINGYTQSGAGQNTQLVGSDASLLIELDGSLLAGSQIYGLTLQTTGAEIRGLVVSGFATAGIFVEGGGNHVIAGNYIGTTADGLARASATTVNEGISILNSSNVRIGGTSPADRNVISGNGLYSINLDGVGNGNEIVGNYIGTTKFGSTLLANGAEVRVDIDGTIVGGDTLTSRNVIVGAGAVVDGITIEGSGVQVKGNYIGLGADGVTRLGVGLSGIRVLEGNAVIGTSTAGNVIVGAGEYGIAVLASGATIQGNFIGTDSPQTLSLANLGGGIFVSTNSATIGGPAMGDGNVIAFNGGDGVRVSGSSQGISIRGNSIYSNESLGINLTGGNELGTGVTTNDLGDGDTGPNGLLNYPILSSLNGNTISGVYNGAPLSTFTVDFYGNSPGDPSGFGEGRLYLGSTTVSTDASGNSAFTFDPGTVISGLALSATATTTGGSTSTSEFSNLLTGSLVYIWDGGGGADASWFNPLNWDLDNGVPGSADTAVLDTNATILIPTQVVVGNFFLDAGTITGPGEFVVMQGFGWTSGTMSGAGITRIDGSLVMSEGLLNLNGRTLTISTGHSAMLTEGTELRLSNGATINNEGFFLAENNSRITDGGGVLSSITNSSSFTIAGPADFNIPVPFTNNTAIGITGQVTFSSDFTQAASGVIAGNGTVTFEGRSSLAGGILANVVNDGGVIFVGGKQEAGFLTINGDFTQLAGSVLSVELGRPNFGSGFDRLSVTGAVALDGTLEVNTIDGYIIQSGDIFDIVSYQSVTGSFSTVRAPAGLSVEPGLTGLALNAQAPTDGVKVLTVTDEDGDLVTVRVNKGLIPTSAFTFGPNGELQILDLRAVGGKLSGAAVTISVEQVEGGNGNVDIGMINASGLNLSKVVVPGDLGQIDIGTGKGKKPALKSLVVNSLGLRGEETQFPGEEDSLLSEINGTVGSLNVVGDVKDAVFNVSGKLGKVSIGGDFLGGNGGGAGLLAAMIENGRIVPRVSGGSPVGAFNAGSIGTFNVNGSMNDSAVSASGNIGSVNVNGNVDKGAILANGQIKNVKVFGAMVSADPDEPAVIAAMARLGSTKPASSVAIDTLKVGGDVENARILLGYNKEQIGRNPDASAGKVVVEGDWKASSLVAGVIDATENGFGLDDATVPGDQTAKIFARIASIVIKGTATGTADAGDHFAITAQEVGKLSINGVAIALDKNAKDNVVLDEVNQDFRLVEI